MLKSVANRKYNFQKTPYVGPSKNIRDETFGKVLIWSADTKVCYSKKMMVRKAKLQKSDSIQFFVNLRDALSAIQALTKKARDGFSSIMETSKM